MSANDQAILERIAQNPNCRAVQLADWLDQPLEDVRAVLAGLIAVGDVTATPGFSPAGTPCQLYDLTEAFKASAAYEPILAKTLAAQFATFRPDLGKTDRAVAFVRERGMATSSELHVVLGLAPDEYASSYLRSAINAGRLVKDGKTWTLGPKEIGAARPQAKRDVPSSSVQATFPTIAPTAVSTPTPTPAPTPDALDTGVELGRIHKPALDVPTFAHARAPTAAPKPAGQIAPDKPHAAPRETAAPIRPSRCRFALWSDGQIEIKIAALPSVELSSDEVDELLRFVAKTNPRHTA